MKIKSGICPKCHRVHTFVVSGIIRHFAMATAAAALGVKRPKVALPAALIALAGNRIEEWLRSRCPHCRVVLQPVRAAGAR